MTIEIGESQEVRWEQVPPGPGSLTLVKVRDLSGQKDRFEANVGGWPVEFFKQDRPSSVPGGQDFVWVAYVPEVDHAFVHDPSLEMTCALVTRQLMGMIDDIAAAIGRGESYLQCQKCGKVVFYAHQLKRLRADERVDHTDEKVGGLMAHCTVGDACPRCGSEIRAFEEAESILSGTKEPS